MQRIAMRFLILKAQRHWLQRAITESERREALEIRRNETGLRQALAKNKDRGNVLRWIGRNAKN